MGSDVKPTSEATSAANLPSVDFSSVLTRTIESIRDDPAQLRNAIYELARIKLQKEASAKSPPLSILETRRLMLALETAIERVETFSSQQDISQANQSPHGITGNTGIDFGPFAAARDPVVVIDRPPAREHASHAAAASSAATSKRNVTGWPRRLGAGPLARTAAVTAVAAALIVIAGRQFAPLGGAPAALSAFMPKVFRSDPSMQGTAENAPQQQPAAAAPSTALPLPSVYGVYAISDGQLAELTALPGRVPDPKVFMSTPINAPSHITLPDGKLTFIVYRRDIASAAPERVPVRVIAKVMRAMTFNAGQANTASVGDQWTIRGTSYDLRVAPVTDNAEMLMLRPESPDFAFPAGRYGLVLKGQAYDFTVAGDIVEPAQCLERVEATNGAFYSECRHP